MFKIIIYFVQVSSAFAITSAKSGISFFIFCLFSKISNLFSIQIKRLKKKFKCILKSIRLQLQTPTTFTKFSCQILSWVLPLIPAQTHAHTQVKNDLQGYSSGQSFSDTNWWCWWSMPSSTDSTKEVFRKADVTVLSDAWLHEKRKGNRSSVASTKSSASVAIVYKLCH